MRVVFGDDVDGAGLLLQYQIDSGDLAADGGVDISGALDRLDGADGVARTDGLALLGKLDVDYIAQLFGGVCGDADDTRGLIGAEVDPLVVLGVFSDFPWAVIVSSTLPFLLWGERAVNCRWWRTRGAKPVWGRDVLL